MLDIIKRLPTIVVKWIEPNLRQYWDTKQPQSWLLALVIGLTVSVAAILFRILIGYVQILWLGDKSENVASAASSLPWYIIFLAPVAGGAVVGLCLVYLLPLRRTLGVADVIEARAFGGRSIDIRSAIYSALVTIVSLGSGASAGREGPMVHLGAAISTALSNIFRMPKWSDRTLLACGVASAVSASFNAPIAGVLFAHEVILGHYSMRAFVPIVISSVSGTVFSRLYFGNAAAFKLPEYQITSLWEFPAFVILGVVCALVAILFQFSLMSSEFVARNINMPLWFRPIIGGAVIGAIAVFLPEILGVGYEATDMALTNQLPLLLMFTLIIAKTIATSITIASRFGGGVFSPALYLGAMTGGTFGIIAASIFPQLASSEGLYAILGMGAVSAAVLGAPISTTMIVFELTGGYGMTIALLLVVSISNGINNAIHGRSIFQWQLEMRGLFVHDGPHRYMMKIKKVMDFMEPAEDHEDPHQIIEDQQSLKPTDTLEYALRVFDSGTDSRLPVVDEIDGKTIIGWATQVQALSYCNAALVEAIDEEHHH
ncbi:MAG: chloride channel protein [Hyphomicrobiales bacterium]|nr:chloride channel protein [Hyphomicrobiales bacterium]